MLCMTSNYSYCLYRLLDAVGIMAFSANTDLTTFTL
jgi:hypothetical protein